MCKSRVFLIHSHSIFLLFLINSHAYSHLKVLTAAVLQTAEITARAIMFTRLPLISAPMLASFIKSIPIPRGITSAIVCSPSGKSSYGMVAPEKNSIGKYKMEVATFKLFVVLQREAAKSRAGLAGLQ